MYFHIHNKKVQRMVLIKTFLMHISILNEQRTYTPGKGDFDELHF